MEETVVFRDPGSADDRVCSGLVGRTGRTPFTRKNGTRFSALERPRNRWMREIARALASLIQASHQRTGDLGWHQISKGLVRRIYLADGGTISCRTGKVWMTADYESEDIVLTACQSQSFPPAAWVLVEALADSRISVASL